MGEVATDYTIAFGDEGEGDTKYTPYGAVQEFMRCKEPEALISGPRETGKTLGALWKLNTLACKYENVSIVIVRKRYADIGSTVLETFKREILATGVPAIPYGGEMPRWYDYPKGGKIWLAGMDKKSKVLSGQHDIIYANQAEELDVGDWEVLTTCTTGRAGNMPYSQTIGDANPAHPTHWALQRRDDGFLTWFDSTHRDNPMLYDPETGTITEQGERTMLTLERLTGVRKLRLLSGIWAAPEGAIYEVFDAGGRQPEEYGRHKVVGFTPPPEWPKIVGIDPFGAKLGAVWVAWDPEARILNVYDEYLGPFGDTTQGHAEKILAKSKGRAIWAWVGGGPGEEAWRLEWRAAGIPLLAPPVFDVWAGIDRVNELLTDFALVVHDNCVGLFSELGSYHRKMKDGRATEQIQDKEDFHLLDALRYAIIWVTQPGEDERVVHDPVRIGMGRRWR